MLSDLRLPSSDTLLHNYKASFYMSVRSCDNMLVQCVSYSVLIN